MEPSVEQPTELMYLLWSHKYSAWWRPGALGYTHEDRDAGRFTEEDAVSYVVASAQCGILSQVTSMVVA